MKAKVLISSDKPFFDRDTEVVVIDRSEYEAMSEEEKAALIPSVDLPHLNCDIPQPISFIDEPEYYPELSPKEYGINLAKKRKGKHQYR